MKGFGFEDREEVIYWRGEWGGGDEEEMAPLSIDSFLRGKIFVLMFQPMRELYLEEINS